MLHGGGKEKIGEEEDAGDRGMEEERKVGKWEGRREEERRKKQVTGEW